MKRVLIITCIGIVFLLSQEQSSKYWIYFSSKDVSLLSKTTSSVEAKAIDISTRALKRRAKVAKPLLSYEDLPVSLSYLNQIKEAGITIENTSRWFNAATAYLTQEQVMKIKQFSFVKEITLVRTFKRKKLQDVESFREIFQKPSVVQKYTYGLSLSQMNFINAVAVHNIGVSGRGVLVGMLDTGFRWRTHEALDHLNVIAEYDFIQKDSITSNEPTDLSPSQDSHGTSTLSLVGGYKDDQLVSPAFNASFILGKTEYLPSETNVEEDNWVAAIEWMEQHGVDVVSSSLGYSEFDANDSSGNPQHSYTYADMDGKTATTSKAAVIAARKGVVVVNAMGNEANAPWHYLTSPADADSIISVGAVNSTGARAGFSSVGPTSDGRMKPDVVALGVGVYSAVPGKIGYSGSQQGTSLSTPLVAGVAAMLLSAHPELTPIQVREALRNTASNTSLPDSSIGWGIIDAYKALLYYGMVISTDPEVSLTFDNNYSVTIHVVSKFPVYSDSIKLWYSTNNGTTFTSLSMTLTSIIDSTTLSGKFSVVIPGSSSDTTIQFYVRAVDASMVRTSPYDAPHQLYNAKSFLTNIKVPPPVPASFDLKQNFPNPFNPKTKIVYDIPNRSIVSLKVYDLLGREVAVLVHEVQEAKQYIVPFNAATLSTGIYFYRIQTETFSETKKMLLLR